MKTVKVRSDYTVELPDELKSSLSPGDSLEVVVLGERVTYTRRNEKDINLRELIDRVRSNPAEYIPTADEIEQEIEEARKER